MQKYSLSEFYKLCKTKTIRIGANSINRGMIYKAQQNGFYPPRDKECDYFNKLVEDNNYQFELQTNSNEYLKCCIEL